MKLRSFISKLQELNAYVAEFPPDTQEQETAPLPANEIMDIIYNSIPTTWKNKMIEQGFNYEYFAVKEMTDFFDTRVEHLKSKEDKKKSSSVDNKGKENNSNKKRKQADSDSSVIESSWESSVKDRTIKKYCILYGKCSHSTDNCKDLRGTVNKHKQKNRRILRFMEKQQRNLYSNLEK